MNSYATASVDAKDSIACLQSYHHRAGAGFVDYGRLYQPAPSSAAAYLDQYRLQSYPGTDHDAYPGGKTTAGTTAAYEQAPPVGYGFFDLPETFRRDQWPLVGSDAGGGGLKRVDSGGEKGSTAASRPCGRPGGEVERSVDSVQVKCEDGVRPSVSHHPHHSQQHQQPQVSSRAVATSSCSPTKHHHSKHAPDSIKSSKGMIDEHGRSLRCQSSYVSKFAFYIMIR